MANNIVSAISYVTAFQSVLIALLGISLIMIFISSCGKKPSTAGYSLFKVPVIIYVIEAVLILVGLLCAYIAFIKSFTEVVNFYNEYLNNTYVGTADMFVEYFGQDLQKELLELFVWDKDSAIQNLTMPAVIAFFAHSDCNVSFCWIAIVIFGVVAFGCIILTIIYFAKLIKSANVVTYILKNPNEPIRRNVSMYAVVYTFIFAFIDVYVSSAVPAIFSSNVAITYAHIIKWFFLIFCGFALARYHRKIGSKMIYH